MKKANSTAARAQNKKKGRATYQAPEIVYEGLITTRAGSGPVSIDEGVPEDSSADPANVFDD